jgi:hypothetical protein
MTSEAYEPQESDTRSNDHGPGRPSLHPCPLNIALTQSNSRPPTRRLRPPKVVIQPVRPRALYAHEHNIHTQAKEWGVSAAEVTITFGADVPNDERERRFGSLVNNVLRRHYGGAIAIREFHDSGLIHYHILILVKGKDIRNNRSALRREQAFWRKCVRSYGLGRHTWINPVRDPLAFARYLVGSFKIPLVADKRIRRISYIGAARNTETERPCLHPKDFNFAYGRSREWRQKLGRLVEAMYLDGYIRAPIEEAFRDAYGPRWMWVFRADINLMSLDGGRPRRPPTYEELRAASARTRKQHGIYVPSAASGSASGHHS